MHTLYTTHCTHHPNWHQLYFHQYSACLGRYFTVLRHQRKTIKYFMAVGAIHTFAPVMWIWVCHATMLSAAVFYFVAFVSIELCDPLFGLMFHYLSNLLHLGLRQRKAEWEPGVRCYKLLARPVARPREPDLATLRLRRVKRCTQRSSLHLYAPYIGRLLLQPTGTWLLAS